MSKLMKSGVRRGRLVSGDQYTVQPRATEGSITSIKRGGVA